MTGRDSSDHGLRGSARTKPGQRASGGMDVSVGSAAMPSRPRPSSPERTLWLPPGGRAEVATGIREVDGTGAVGLDRHDANLLCAHAGVAEVEDAVGTE